MTEMLDAAVRPSVILLAGLLGTTLLSRRSAALRHLVVAGALLSAAAAVPMGEVVPAWEVRVMPAAPTDVGPYAAPAAAASVGADADASMIPAGAGGFGWLRAIWLAGVAVFSGMLFRDFVRLRRISIRGIPVRDARCVRLAERAAARLGVRRRVAILHTGEPGLIATWGWFRPRVALPASARDWQDDRLLAVLCHEIAHIHRRDWLVQVAAELLRAFYWFNPLFWIACGRLRRESEQACDDAVLRAGVPAGEYARHLVEVVRACRPASIGSAPAILASRPSQLERRFAAMLSQKVNRDAVSRPAALAAVLLLLAVSVPVSAVRLAQDGPLPLVGSVYDPTGAVLPGVELTLQDWQQFVWQATTNAAGQFEFPPVQPGRYVLEAKLPGFRAPRHEFQLEKAADWNRAITLQVGDLTETVHITASRLAPPTAAPAEAPQRIRVGGNIRAPRKVRHVNPIYPASMREAGRAGVVPIEAVIDTQGAVVALRVLGAHVHPDFAAAALDAVRQWQFTPTLLNGAPVEVRMTVHVRFDLAQ